MGGSDRRPALPGSGPPPQGKFAWPDEELKRRAALAGPCPRAARRPGQRGSAAGVGKRHHTEQEAAADRFCRDVLVSPACGGAAEAPIAGTPPRPQAGDRGPEAVAFDEWVGSAVSVMGVAVGSAASQLGGPANNLLGDMRVALFPEADGQGQEPVASQDITEFLGQTRSGLSPATGGGEGERVTSQDDNAFLKISGVVRRHRLSRLRRAFPRNISITHDRNEEERRGRKIPVTFGQGVVHWHVPFVRLHAHRLGGPPKRKNRESGSCELAWTDSETLGLGSTRNQNV